MCSYLTLTVLPQCQSLSRICRPFRRQMLLHSVPSEPPNGLAASYYYCTVSGMSTSALCDAHGAESDQKAAAR